MRRFQRIIFILLSIIMVVAIIFLLGPIPDFEKITYEELPSLNLELVELEEFIEDRNRQLPNLKPDNGSYIVWADSLPKKTTYSVVYLHGFSASPAEGDPTHKAFARRYGMNLYAPLLPQHGIEDPEAFLNLTPVSLIEAAREALTIGRLLGDSVILMSCSTGSTLSLYLAAKHPELVRALIMYSPNIELDNPAAKLITGHWGHELTQMIQGKYRSFSELEGTETDKYWTITYRTEGLIALQNLIDQTMGDELLSCISTPYFIGYYYQTEEESDHVISVPRILQFHSISSTEPNLKRIKAFPHAGAHVITSPIKSKDVQSVQNETYAYAEEVLGIKPIKR
jgi:pimeloyl-ACP methyl ester carboxylesterase